MIGLDQIDFRRQRQSGAWGWALLLTGVSLALAQWGWWEFHERQRAQTAASVKLDAQAQEVAGQRLAAAQAASQALQRRQMDHVLALQGRPWLAALAAIEDATDVTDGGVYLLAVSFDATSGRMQLNGEADHADALSAFTQRLSASPALGAVQLALEEPMVDGQPAGAVRRFQLLARWVGR